MDKNLVVIMASDDNYSFLLGIALYSLFRSNLEFETINIYVIDDNISGVYKDKLQKLANRFGHTIKFIPRPNIPSKVVVKGKLNISTFYRLAVCSLLPEEIKKVLYLDCDVIVQESLIKLWNEDIDDVYIAGVQDTTGKEARTSVELNIEDDYVNAGVLLVNIDKLRKDGMESLFFEYLKEKKYKVEFNDQGIINHCCKGRIKLIHPKYNFMYPYDRYNRKQLLKIVQKPKFYSESIIEEAKNNPIIIHFAGYAFTRPWYEDSKGRFVNKFIKLAEESGFEFTPQKQPISFKYKIRRLVYKLPNCLAIMFNNLIDVFYGFFQKAMSYRCNRNQGK